MLTSNYYNIRFNNRHHTSNYTNNNNSVNNVISGLKQFRFPNGNFSTGNTFYQYGGGDVLFGAMPKNVVYSTNGNVKNSDMAIGFDGSNTPASIDDYKLIEPIDNCSIITVTYSSRDNTIIRDFTIKNNNNNEIIINGVGLFGVFTYYTSSSYSIDLPLLYREVFASPITVPAGASFIYRLETTEGE